MVQHKEDTIRDPLEPIDLLGFADQRATAPETYGVPEMIGQLEALCQTRGTVQRGEQGDKYLGVCGEFVECGGDEAFGI